MADRAIAERRIMAQMHVAEYMSRSSKLFHVNGFHETCETWDTYAQAKAKDDNNVIPRRAGAYPLRSMLLEFRYASVTTKSSCLSYIQNLF